MGVALFILTACASSEPRPGATAGTPAPDVGAAAATPPRGAGGDTAYTSTQPVAFVNGETITLADLRAPLIEVAGGQVLAEVVIDRMLDRRLTDAKIALTPEHLEAERAMLVEVLTPEAAEGGADEAARLLAEVRRRRGLGDRRFTALLRRNAAMRALVRDQVNVTPEALQRAYRLAYGEQYVARIIVVPTLQDAARLRDTLAGGGTSFADLAVKRSTDPSAVQGGLLPPISPVDEEVPKPIRDALVSMDGEGTKLSDAIALPNGYAILNLERKEAARAVELSDVQDDLTDVVRRSAERVLMQQLARELLAAANVTVLDPALSEGWRQQRGVMLGQ